MLIQKVLELIIQLYGKKNVILVNTSRGEIVKEIDLINFLKKNKQAKYYADVVSNEQSGIKNNKIINEFKKNSKQILVTPHIGGMTSDGQKLAYDYALNMLIEFNRKIIVQIDIYLNKSALKYN